MNISVIGLGKLGLCTAVCFASRGNKVFAFDKNEASMQALRRKECPIDETGLDDLLNTCWDKLVFCSGIKEAVLQSEITLIVVPTPSGPDGAFDNAAVEAVLQEIGRALKKKKTFHIVDVVSTVMPGTSETVFKPLLEKASGSQCIRDFGLVYNPEFIALGTVIRNFMHPDMVLIGASDENSARTVQSLYQTLFDRQPHYALMSLTNAEITKLSLNCFVTMKISFANEIAALCERIPGADAAVVTSALGADTRIGARCLKPGLGFGGPCFPRDNIALQTCGKQHGYTLRIGPQVVAVNNEVVGRIAEKIEAAVAAPGPVAVLGLSYKPVTHIIEESHSVKIVQKLLQSGYGIRVHDPMSLPECRKNLREEVTYCDDPYACCENAAAVLILTPWPQFLKLDWKRIEAGLADGAHIVDAWRPAVNRLARGEISAADAGR